MRLPTAPILLPLLITLARCGDEIFIPPADTTAAPKDALLLDDEFVSEPDANESPYDEELPDEAVPHGNPEAEREKDRHKGQTRLTSFNATMARELYDMAAAAYGSKSQDCIEKNYGPNHQRRILLSTEHECDDFDSLCSSFIVVCDQRKEIIVAYRGTKGPRQLLIEGLHAFKDPMDFLGMGPVNYYFYSAQNTIWPQVKEVLADPKWQNYSLLFTGHSLGGALASLTAARAVKEGIRSGDMVTVITFGSPRVGTGVFATNYEKLIKNSFRVVNRHDIIPHLPLCVIEDEGFFARAVSRNRPCDSNRTDGYYHFGTEIWFKDGMAPDQDYIECVGSPQYEDNNCSNQYKFWFGKLPVYLNDHLHYYETRVSRYGKSGCRGNYTYWTKLRNKVGKMVKSVKGFIGSIRDMFEPSGQLQIKQATHTNE